MQYQWTRRHFLQAAGLSIAAQSLRVADALPAPERPTHAYVAVKGGLHVLRVKKASWQPLQFVKTVAPSAVLLNDRSGLLFVANARTHFEGLPTATVESYRVDPVSRMLTLVAAQKLGLATVVPHALALSPDGSLLVVAAAAGLYNVLPVTPDGVIGEVTAVRKELEMNAASSTRMRFVTDHQLQVQDAAGTRLYRCDANGMVLLQAPPLSASERDLTPLLVTGQRSVAFARFA